MTLPIDDPPTEALPVVPEAPADDRRNGHRLEPGDEPRDDYDDNRDADLFDEWKAPRHKSHMTTVLVVALLLAVGFLAGVYVGRAAGASNAPERGGGPAATSTPRAGTGGGGARVGGGVFRAF
jgi:hypothetical protein